MQWTNNKVVCFILKSPCDVQLVSIAINARGGEATIPQSAYMRESVASEDQTAARKIYIAHWGYIVVD
jgi:hypothetical protein